MQGRAGLDSARVRVATFKDIEPLLDRAVAAGMGTLDLFTDKELADPSAPALLLDGQTLRQIDAKYKLSGVWLISAPTLMPDHRALTMDYMIVGQGKLIVGYPYESLVEVVEEGKPLEYRYEPFIEASIVNSGTRQGLFEIKALNDPAADFLPFQGLMGSALKARAALGYSLSDRATIWLGYTYLPTQIQGRPYIAQQDLWPAFRYILPTELGTFMFRTMFETNFIRGDDPRFRPRQMIRFLRPFEFEPRLSVVA